MTDGSELFALKDLSETGNFLDSKWQKKIWLPPLYFSNTNGNSPLLNKDQTVEILKQGDPKLNSENELNSAYTFEGSENDLSLFGQYQHNFDCDYHLSNFPFDTQDCSIELRVPLEMRKYISLKPNTLKYTGK